MEGWTGEEDIKLRREGWKVGYKIAKSVATIQNRSTTLESCKIVTQQNSTQHYKIVPH
jgi:hypothetical protein